MIKKLLLIAVLLLGSIACQAVDMPVVSIPRVNSAPSIDGQIDQDEWSNAAVTCGFHDIEFGYPAVGKTIVSACYDQSALYILYRCYGEDLNKLPGSLTDRDTQVWCDSEVEFFILSPKWSNKYSHFMLNHAGAIADETYKGKGDLNWNPDWKYKTARTDDMWYAEIAIPWTVVDVIPETGTVLRTNFARNAVNLGEYSSWSPIIKSLHKPKEFGKMILAGDSAVVAISDLPGREIADTVLHSTILGNIQHTSCDIASEIVNDKGKKSTKSVAGTDLPIVIDYSTNSMTIKAVTDKKHVIWQQSLKYDIPDLPGKVESLQKALNSLHKK